MNESGPIPFNNGIGIQGVKTGTRSGSFLRKFIPAIYVVVEDPVAKGVIESIIHTIESKPACKFMVVGAWKNLVSSLYGFLKYGDELHSNFRIPAFSIVAIHDGDITALEITKRINSVINGDHPPAADAALKEIMTKSILGLNLQHTDKKQIAGLPEYNHKMWFEEINEQEIVAYHQRELEGLDEVWKIRCKQEIKNLLEIIDYSKSMFFEVSNGKKDYHKYYELLKKARTSTTEDKLNQAQWYVLKAIQRYNPARWNSYTKEVRSKIEKVARENKERFLNSDFYFN